MALSELDSRSLLVRFYRTVKHDKGALVGLVFIGGIVVLVILAPYVATNGPTEVNPQNRLLQPTLKGGYLLGGDQVGRCIFSRILWGGRMSLKIALLPIVFSLAIGVPLGMVSAYYGGYLDSFIMRCFDVLLSFPSILLALAIAATLGPGMENAILAVSVISIPILARLTRGVTLEVKERDYVMAAIALGAPVWRILFRHVLANILAPLIVHATLEIGRVAIIAAGLSFLGLGVQPPTPDWGTMLAEGRNVIMVAPHVSTFPGIFLFVFCLGSNLLGDSLRDALDPTIVIR